MYVELIHKNGSTYSIGRKEGWSCSNIDIDVDDIDTPYDDVIMRVTTPDYCSNLDVWLLRYAHDKGYLIRNCKVCKFHKYNNFQKEHICTLYKNTEHLTILWNTKQINADISATFVQK